MTEAAVFLVGVLAGSIAAVTGFGIGSLLTPVLALTLGTRLAVAAVAVPHAVGTAIRFWRLRTPPDRRVLWSFGIASAAGGLAGALLHGSTDSPWLTVVFGGLLVFSGLSEWFGWTERRRFKGTLAWAAGGLSGFFGGLVGNQGGIRSAALLGFDLRRDTFRRDGHSDRLDRRLAPECRCTFGASAKRWSARPRGLRSPRRASWWVRWLAAACCSGFPKRGSAGSSPRWSDSLEC